MWTLSAQVRLASIIDLLDVEIWAIEGTMAGEIFLLDFSWDVCALWDSESYTTASESK